MKKLISILLAAIMLFSFAVPAFALGGNEKAVNVYLYGYGGSLYDETGKQTYPVNLDLANGLKAILSDLLKNLAKGMIFGDYDEYCDQIYNLIAPAYADLKLDKNGEATDDNGNPYYGLKQSPLELTGHSNSKFDGGYYRFDYDWRLSSEYNGELLEKFIDIVAKKEGATKVNLIGRCLGGNIISAYLQNASQESLDMLNKVIMYIPSTIGVDFIGALFSGNITLDPDAVDNYVKYSLADNDILGGDDELAQMLTVFVEFVNEAHILGIGTDVVEKIVQDIKYNALARVLRDSYATFPSFWSMVGDEYIDDALELCFPTKALQDEYAGLISKAKSYNENVQLNAYDTMKALSAKGVDIMVLSKYNFANFPLSENARAQSDSTASTTATSFGAVTSNFGETLSDKYLNSISKENRKYLSADNMIDASTCLFPEKTWFAKNLNHADFPDSVDKLMNTFLNTENMTVDTYEEYPQFMKYDEETDTLSLVTGLDDGDLIKKDTGKKVSAFIRFFTLIFNLIAKLFRGEINIGG